MPPRTLHLLPHPGALLTTGLLPRRPLVCGGEEAGRLEAFRVERPKAIVVSMRLLRENPAPEGWSSHIMFARLFQLYSLMTL